MECNKGDGDLVDWARWEETILDNELEWMRMVTSMSGGLNSLSDFTSIESELEMKIDNLR